MIYQKEKISQFLKYIIVGALNFILTIGIFYMLLKVLFINYLISFTIIWILSLLITYILNFLWVFKPQDKLEFKKRLPKYFTVYLSSYLINILCLRYLVSSIELDPFYAQFLLIPLLIFFNFFGFKYWGLK